MKANIEFDDEKELLRFLKATDMALVLWEAVYNGWANLGKYADKPEEYKQGVRDALDYIRDLMEEHGILIDDLVE